VRVTIPTGNRSRRFGTPELPKIAVARRSDGLGEIAMKTKPIAYHYARFSTPEQADGTSLIRQTKAARRWCDANGYRLDESTTFRDMGVSGYHGHNLKDGSALAAFLDGVKSGRIPKGSVLLVENADRLTRQGGLVGFTLVQQIVSGGVRVVILDPRELVLTADMDEMTMILLVLELARGHGESNRKHKMISAAWQSWRETGKSKGGTIRPGPVPFWISRKGTGYVLNEHQGTARLIFTLATEGYGCVAIRSQLVRLKVRTIAKCGSDGIPSYPYIRTVLANPAAYGRCDELDNDNYFPALLTRDQFFAVRAVVEERTRRGKPREKDQIRLLAGLLKNWRTGASYFARRMDMDKRPGRNFVYAPYTLRSKVGDTDTTTFPVLALERAMLEQLRELDPAKIFGRATVNKLDSLRGELDSTKKQLTEVQAIFDESPSKGVASSLARLEKRVDELQRDIAAERARIATPASEAFLTLRELAAGEMDEPTRVKVRTALRGCIKTIRIAFAKCRIWRMAFASVEFRDSDHTREFVALYRRPVAGMKPEYLWSGSQRMVKDAELSTPEDAWGYLAMIVERVEAEEQAEWRAKRNEYLRGYTTRITEEQRAKRRAKSKRAYWKRKEREAKR
jgi:DNA invertase Pin-like site-specific DNA recombinase